MKIALLADIHGNMDALDAVLAQLTEEGIDKIFVLGDIVGYYYRAREVVDKLEKYDVSYCRGNHEDMIAVYSNGTTEEKDTIVKKYGSGLKVALEALSEKQISWLINLPHPVGCEIDGVRIVLSHGAPWDINAYIYPDTDLSECSELSDYLQDNDLICTSHTHYQKIWCMDDKIVVNPGSIGQPRSGVVNEDAETARAQWGIYNTKTREVELKTTYYEPAQTIADVEKYDPDLHYLKDVLKRQDIGYP